MIVKERGYSMGRNQVETVKGTHKLEINYSLPIIGIPGLMRI